MRKNKAYSLVEASIIVLIVGLLVAAVASGTIMFKKAKLRTAQSLTNSSIVNSIDGLKLWLETTREESFDRFETKDGDTVTIWHDTNGQKRKPLYALEVSPSVSSIKYVKYSELNDLPALDFDDTAASYLMLSSSPTSIKSTVVPTKNNAFTFFTVTKRALLGKAHVPFYNGTYGVDGWGLQLAANEVRRIKIRATNVQTDPDDVTTKPEITSATFEGGELGEIKMYLNGLKRVVTVDNATAIYPTTGFYIGSRGTDTLHNYNGLIAEIIIFDHKLSDSDRHEIEQYLGKKYNITVVQDS